MDIAALNERITFQTQQTLVDAIGNHTNVWVDAYRCFATVNDSHGKTTAEGSVTGQTVDTADITFTVRFCKAVCSVSTTGYRIVWNGDLYNIIKIDHLGMKRKALKFKCEKVRR